MLVSYKIELFLVTFVAFGLMVAIDLNSEPGSEFIDYRNLQSNDVEDIGGFFVLVSFFSIFFSILFHMLRIVLLRKFEPVHFFYNRILLLFCSVLIVGSLILFIYNIDNIDMSTETENLSLMIVAAIQSLFLCFYFIRFFKESKSVYLQKINDDKSLINELHDS